MKEQEEMLDEQIKIDSESNRPLTLKEAEDKGYDTFVFENGDYSYEDSDGIFHLIRDNIEIASGQWVWSYRNGDYEYRDTNGIEHLIRDGVEIDGGKCVCNMDNYYEVKKDGITFKILKEKKEEK